MSNFEELRKIAQKLRVSIIEMLTEAKSGHPGGSLSAVEIVAALYFSELQHDPKNPSWPDRDRFVISKGHGVPAVYAAMAKTGYFPESELMTLRKTGARLQGHPDRVRLPGIEASTGSLGQGLSVAQGMALAARLSPKPWHTYCLLGDGEIQEGQIWEAAMSAPMFKLAFNWNVVTVNGHKFEELMPALQAARKSKDKPTMIIANTIKGKGVSFMEHQNSWHGSAPNKDQMNAALAEINKGLIYE
jgi:transketolase